MDIDLSISLDDVGHRAVAAHPDRSVDRDDVIALIGNGGPTIAYQPIVHVETGQLLGVEALSRFAHGAAGRWFATAGETGLTADLELVAARNALHDLPAWRRELLGWEMIGINLSPETLLDRRADELLRPHIGSHVVLELTTTGNRADWGVVRTCVDRARELGARIGLNAVTSDPSAQFNRLLEIAPEVLKLSTAYTTTLFSEVQRGGEASDFLVGCQHRGMFVVGVGVEHPGDLRALRQLGVDAAQGYLIGRPIPVDDYVPARPGRVGCDEFVFDLR